ncbi:MAG: hypothetical protein M3290_13120 [Actinomycetota bacterium]|nr:hypothetical protein [Actinomycetota bacterium]
MPGKLVRRCSALAVAALALGALLIPSAASAKASATGPVTVGTDPAGDWGQAAAPDASLYPVFAQLGDSLGQDLTGAAIAKTDAKTLTFTITVHSLPVNGGVPEVSRYGWDMSVDGKFVELDGKWTNYTRGACDPTSGQCPPPRDPGMQPFLVRGDCTTTSAGSNVTTCKELGIVHATFDASKGTISIPVPMDLIHAKPGSKIGGMAGDFSSLLGGPVYAVPATFLSESLYPADAIAALKTYTVPK